MTDFQVGDRVRATHEVSKDTAEFTVTETTGETIETEDLIFFVRQWNFELIERPYKLPTKPGLYQIHEDLYDNPSPNIRIFSLLRDGRWEEFGNPGVDKTDRLKRSEWPLKRLVYED